MKYELTQHPEYGYVPNCLPEALGESAVGCRRSISDEARVWKAACQLKDKCRPSFRKATPAGLV